MSDLPEQSSQSDWILPGSVGTNGVPNTAVLAVGTTATTVDLASLPTLPMFYDRSVSAISSNPLGHYVNFQAQGADIFALFGPTFASLALGQVASATVATGGIGSGYTTTPTVAFSGGAGSGAAGTAVVVSGVLQSITMTANGSGYTSAPTIAFTGGGGSGAAATANLGGPANSTTSNTVNGSTGVVTITRGTAIWIPTGQTLPVKLPVGSPQMPWGTNSPYRFLSYIAGSGTTATLRVWQSSP